MIADVLTTLLLTGGTAFFIAGTIGLLRLPDVYTRLHALTKADNVGLGLIVAGLALQAESWADAGKLGLIWALVLVASATGCQIVAHVALRRGIAPWTR